ncbi:unnamed protein product [Closterium sp. Naga37s-1]|nr:unnamed protein product [Closterium sp. Naga37s-1]
MLIAALPLGLAAFAFILHLQGDFDMLDDGQPRLPGWHQVDFRKPDKSLATPSDVPYSDFLAVLSFAFACSSFSPLASLGAWVAPHTPGVTVVQRTKELEDQQAKSRVWNETWLAFFFYKPCNYELFVRQSLNMEMAIVFARVLGVDWIFHVDTDELLYPAGTADFSLQRLIHDLPSDVDLIVFPNYESVVETADVGDSFTEVSLFKKNYDHVTREAYFAHYRDAAHGNPNYFLTYGNGKSGAKMQAHLRPNGAHRWHNYMKVPKEVKLMEAAVLHFTYTHFSDLTSRRDRCGCKPNSEDVKKCFMLDFDRLAFIIASTQTEEQMFQWYKDHVVWSDRDMIEKLLKKGIFGRIHTPQLILRSIYATVVINRTLEAAAERWKRCSQQQQVHLFPSHLSHLPTRLAPPSS